MIDEALDKRIRRLENDRNSTYDMFGEIQSDVNDVRVQTMRLVERADRTDKRLKEMQENLNKRFGKVEDRFNAVDERFNAVDTTLATMNTTLAVILSRLPELAPTA
jgi:chaperonin cofactor prefoldin